MSPRSRAKSAICFEKVKFMKRPIFIAVLLSIGFGIFAGGLFHQPPSVVRAQIKKPEDEKVSVKIEIGEGMLDDDRGITVVGWEEIEIKPAEKDKKAVVSKDEILLVEIVVINRSEVPRSVLSVLGIFLSDASGKKYQPIFGGSIKSSDAGDGEYELSNLGDTLKDNEQWFGKIGFRISKAAKDVDAVFEFEDEFLTVDLGRTPNEVRLDQIKWEGDGERQATGGKAGSKGSAANSNNEPEFEFVDENANSNSANVAANSNNQPEFEFTDESKNSEQEIAFEMACDAPKPFNGSLCENSKWLTAEEMDKRLAQVETDRKPAEQDVFNNQQPIKLIPCSECKRADSLRCTLVPRNTNTEVVSVCNPVSF